MLITVQPNPSWQLSLAQLSPSLFSHFLWIFGQISDINILFVVLMALNLEYLMLFYDFDIWNQKLGQDRSSKVGTGYVVNCQVRHVNSDWTQNSFWIQILGPQIFLNAISLDPNFVWAHNFFGPTFCYPKSYRAQNLFCPKFFWIQNSNKQVRYPNRSCGAHV